MKVLRKPWKQIHSKFLKSLQYFKLDAKDNSIKICIRQETIRISIFGTTKCF